MRYTISLDVIINRCLYTNCRRYRDTNLRDFTCANSNSFDSRCTMPTLVTRQQHHARAYVRGGRPSDADMNGMRCYYRTALTDNSLRRVTSRRRSQAKGRATPKDSRLRKIVRICSARRNRTRFSGFAHFSATRHLASNDFNFCALTTRCMCFILSKINYLIILILYSSLK